MLADRRALSGGSDPRPFPCRTSFARPLRSGCGRGACRPRGDRSAPDRPVALARAAAGARQRRYRQPGRDRDAAHSAAEIRRPQRAGEGRGPPADRIVQGARAGDGGGDGQGARHHAHRHAHQRQCRRRARRLCQPGGHRDDRLLSRRHARDQRARDRDAGRARVARQRPDRRLRRDRRRGRETGPLVRFLDAQGAVSDRGQEDDGARAGRPVRLDAAQGDLLSHRRRHRPDRHVEGVPGAGNARLDRRGAAEDVRPSRRPAARRSSRRSTREPSMPSAGRARIPSPRA